MGFAIARQFGLLTVYAITALAVAIQEYVSRRKEPKKRYRRRSTFGVGLDGEKWVNYLEQYSWEMEQLMKLTPSKRRFYQQGMRAATLIQSIS